MIREGREYSQCVTNMAAQRAMKACDDDAELLICVVDKWGNKEFMGVHAIGQLCEEGTGRVGAVVLYHVEGRGEVDDAK